MGAQSVHLYMYDHPTGAFPLMGHVQLPHYVVGGLQEGAVSCTVLQSCHLWTAIASNKRNCLKSLDAFAFLFFLGGYIFFRGYKRQYQTGLLRDKVVLGAMYYKRTVRCWN